MTPRQLVNELYWLEKKHAEKSAWLNGLIAQGQGGCVDDLEGERTHYVFWINHLRARISEQVDR